MSITGPTYPLYFFAIPTIRWAHNMQGRHWELNTNVVYLGGENEGIELQTKEDREPRHKERQNQHETKIENKIWTSTSKLKSVGFRQDH